MIPSPSSRARPSGPLDLLRLPGLGRFLRWRHARTTLQVVTLGLAVVILLDGFFGPQLAPRNLAGVIPWVHWRGFVVLALLVVGNLFCMACPFMLPRRLARKLLPARLHWPAPLRSKWLAVALLAVFFWAYEAFSLWASPWLTAWVALSYFVLAFVIDGFFRGASFCRYLCPIGQFHFVGGMISPFEVRARDAEVCARCETKDCIRGRYRDAPLPGTPRGGDLHATGKAADGWADGALSPGGPAPGDGWAGRPLRPDPLTGRLALAGAGMGGGASPAPRAATAAVASSGRARGAEGLVQQGCEMALYLPRKEGNLDCTFCMECIHACPHENVGILGRSPLREFAVTGTRAGVGRIQARPDLAALALLLTWGAFLNAFGMVEPVFRLQGWLAGTLGITSRSFLLAGFFLLGLVLVPGAVTWVTARLSGLLAGSSEPTLSRATRYAWGLVPLGFGMWTAHYLFHFLVGALTVVPVVQQYLLDLGLPAGQPGWGLGAVVPESWLFPLELVFLQGGLLLSLVATWRLALGSESSRRRAQRAFLPWAVLATLLAATGIWLLLQPMEMRGTFMAPVPGL